VQSFLAKRETAGLMDMGGASVELSFVPSKPEPRAYDELWHYFSEVPLMDFNTTVYTYSYLGLGIVEARKEYRTRLATKFFAEHPNSRTTTT